MLSVFVVFEGLSRVFINEYRIPCNMISRFQRRASCRTDCWSACELASWLAVGLAGWLVDGLAGWLAGGLVTRELIPSKRFLSFLLCTNRCPLYPPSFIWSKTRVTILWWRKYVSTLALSFESQPLLLHSFPLNTLSLPFRLCGWHGHRRKMWKITSEIRTPERHVVEVAVT